MQQNKYEPDGIDFAINAIWNFIIFSCAVGGSFALFYVDKFDMKFFSGVFFVTMAWLNIISAHISIRRLDRKYRDRLLTDPRAGTFIIIPFAFSRETLIKLRWLRASVYLFAYRRWPSLRKLRKEILPDFDFKKEVYLIDKILYWGQGVSIFVFIGLAMFANWHK